MASKKDESCPLPSVDVIRLPPSPNYKYLEGLKGKLFMAPWFDAIALNIVARWYCPLSRAWAAATISGGSPELFGNEIAASGLNCDQYLRVLNKVSKSNQEFSEICNTWETYFFDKENPNPNDLIESQISLVAGEHRQLSMRRYFFSLRPHIQPLKLSIATPQEVESIHTNLLKENPFPSPPTAKIDKSASVYGEWGEEFHLKTPVPFCKKNDIVRAQVFMPHDGNIKGTFICLHGILLDPAMWNNLAYPVKALTREGIRVVLPTGPWHGRRTPKGQFGGENILRCGPLGFIEALRRWVPEVAIWTRWARSTSPSPVGLGGVSLGGLCAQLSSTAANDWPDSDRHDALILITTSGDMNDVAFNSNIGDKLNLTREIKRKGWTTQTLKRWLPLLQPTIRPPLMRNKIVMLLGSADRLTPFEGGLLLSRNWEVPEENLFIRRQGHFTGALGLSHDSTPLKRFVEILLE